MTIDLPLLGRGKVRDLYDGGDGLLLLVTSDRISAYDVVLAEPIPDKGRVLTALTAHWSAALADAAPMALVSTDLRGLPPELAGRVMWCRRAEMLPLECIVRGHLAGSAWQEYAERGTVHGRRLPAGLREADALPEALFTPSTKAEPGEHDRNLTFDEAVEIVGAERAEEARALCLDVFRRGAEAARTAGLVVADTKLELGLVDGALTVCDEVLTPDSARFWPAGGWSPGSSPPSFDKQPLRDFLAGLDWDRRPPPPPLPPEVVEATRRRYVEAAERITGRRDWG